MAQILGVGIATLDIINQVGNYPREDSEIRALAHSRVRGGNATNTLVVLSQLGHKTHWAGVLPDDPDSELVEQDLRTHQINLDAVWRPAGGKLPVSCILLNAKNGSRSIVHYRDLPEYSFAHFDRIDLRHFDWIHFEGRNVPELMLMLEKTTALQVPCSLEIEKPREGIEALLELPDVLLFSRAYAFSQGFQDPATFLHDTAPGENTVFLAWGHEGAWALDSGKLLSQVAPAIEALDTLGAGDVFNAAVIHGCLQRQPVAQTLKQAVWLASCHCKHKGFSGLSDCANDPSFLM